VQSRDCNGGLKINPMPVGDIDDELLEQQEQEQEQKEQDQKEHDNLGPQFEAGGNGMGNGSDSDDDNNNRNKKKIELAFKKAEEIAKPLFKDQYGVCYGWIDISGHREVLRIESGKFKRLLFRLSYNNVGYVASRNTIDNWVHIFHAFADFEGPIHQLSSRVTPYNGDIYYDLTNEIWQCVRITNSGWEILDSTPIPLFVRHNQTAQILPNRNYDPDIFDRFLQIINAATGNQERQILLKVYIISLFVPDIPHVMLVLHGEKGSAKTTLQTLIKLLVDPSKPRLLTIHNDRTEFIQQLAHNYVAYYDNVRGTPDWLSDEACKAVTGVGQTKRKLFTDDDDIIYEYKRCLGFNGINLSLTEPDALDRSIMIDLETIDKSKRKQESEIIAEFQILRPDLLGYILDILVKALQIKPTLQLQNLPRMADFAIWGEAIARAMGYHDMKFLNAYFENIGKQNVEAVEGSILGQTFLKFVDGWYEKSGDYWYHSTSKLLEELNSIAAQTGINTARYWPKSTDSLTRKLRTIASSLKEGYEIGIDIARDTTGTVSGRKGASIVQIWKIASPASPPHLNQIHARNMAKSGEATLDSEAIASPSEAISGGSIHAQNEASEAIFRIEEPQVKAKVTEELAQTANPYPDPDTTERDIRDIIVENRENLYRVKRSDTWACRNCRIRSDRKFMEIHLCSRSRSKKPRNKGALTK
jgi:hypothetical protein